MAIEKAAGKNIDVSFDSHKCIHSRNCVLSLTRVFKANVEGPWIDPDASLTEEVAAVVRLCPSGALKYTRHDGGEQEQKPEVNRLHVQENGPYVVRGDIHIDGKAAGYRAVFCRCGDSKRKPFCDHTHVEAGFAATGEPPTQAELRAVTDRGGKLNFVPQKNGPLKVEGQLEILAGSGRRINLTRTVYLCRCGNSKNKPYCDGSHERVGFIADGEE